MAVSRTKAIRGYVACMTLLFVAAPLQAETPDDTIEEAADDAAATAQALDFTLVPIPQLSPALGFGVTLAAPKVTRSTSLSARPSRTAFKKVRC